MPPILEVFAANKQLYDRYEFGYEIPRRADVVPAEAHVRMLDEFKDKNIHDLVAYLESLK